MYTATMRYTFKKESFTEACRFWETEILAKAKTADGLVRMQFLTSEPKALAIGTWNNKKHAEAFMQTGVFKELMGKIEPLLACAPESEQWELSYYYDDGPKSR